MLKKMWRIFALFIVNHLLHGTHFFGLKRILLNTCFGISVGNNTKIVGPIKTYGGLEIGSNCWIGRNFVVEGNGRVIIKDNCNFAPSVHCFTGSHEFGDENKRAGKGFNGSITIGRGCWICGEVKIVPDIVIEDGVVVACGAVVAKNIRNNCLVGGVPATIIREFNIQ